MKRFGLILFCTMWSFGQQKAGPAFEVASIKPSASVTGNSGTRSSGSQITMENISLEQLIQTAYSVKSYSYSGPAWLDTARFDIVAKAPPRDTASYLPPDYPAMLQNLLAERFKLAVHRETKVLSCYALLVDKRGFKLQPVTPRPGGTSWGRGMVRANGVSMAQFADQLENAVDRPVKDMTNVQGVFDIEIRWTPDTASADIAVPDGRSTSLFSALQEQLGLRLESRKLPIEILVVDHIEKMPTGN